MNNPIGKVTVQNLDAALRVLGINLGVTVVDKIIDLVELIEEKGDDTNLKDIFEVKSNHTK